MSDCPRFRLVLLILLVTWVVFGSAPIGAAQHPSTFQPEGQVFGPYATTSSAENSVAFPLAEEDSMILQGEVLRIVSVLEGPLIVSYVAILVTQVVTGPDSLLGTEILLQHLGGEVNGVLLWLSDQPYFAVGETVEVKVRQEGNVYVPVSPKKTLATPTNVLATAAGYLLQWYKPGTGWMTSTTRPGADWYGPLKWSGGGFEYWINTQGIPSDLSGSSFVTYATACFQTWEDDLGSSVDFTYRGTRTDTVPEQQDGINLVGWGLIGGSTIALTSYWGVYSTGNYDSLRITETDVKFDSSKLWSAQPSGVAGRFDVQNIGAHEAGHTFGLADLYESADSEQTMYGYADLGETKKRTLEWGDLAGVAALYPSTGGYTVSFLTYPASGMITADGVLKTNGETGTYASGARVHVVANPPPGCSFSYWEASGVSVDSTSSAETYMTVSNNGWLKAYFAQAQQYVLHVQSSPVTGVSISYSGSYSGSGNTNFDVGPKSSSFTVTLNAPSTYGTYRFSHWTLDGSNMGSSPSLTVAVDDSHKDRTAVAVYVSGGLGETISTVFSDTTVALGFMETGNIYDDSGIGFIYAHRSPPKILFTKTDTTRVFATGQPTWLGYTHLVAVGGRLANPTTKYYEDLGSAPLKFAGNGTHAVVMKGSEIELIVSWSSLNSANDYFVMEAITDGTHKVIILWGMTQWGTYASGIYFDGKFTDLASLGDGWYIVRWQDLNANTVPDYPTEFTVVASGA